MDYKGYEAVFNYDEEAKLYSGEVINTKDVITFQSESVSELEKAFHESVDDYLEFCESRGEKAAKVF